MPTTIDFNGVPAGPFNSYQEDGFRFYTSTNAPNSFWGGLSVADLGTGDYIFIHNTTDTATVDKAAGGAFGVVSLYLDGFRWTGFTPDGQPIPGSSAVTINFIGYKSDGTTVTTSVSTDAASGFEVFTLPSQFAGGLLAFQWYAEGGSGLALVDNLVLQENRAPVASDFQGRGAAGTTFRGQLSATDPDGQVLTFQRVGELPQGVTLDPNGRFYVQPLESDLDLSQGETRVVTFKYRVWDGEAYSEVRTATYVIEGQSAPGMDLCHLGTNRPDNVVGDSGGDTLCGGNQNDTLSGLRGNDLLHGDNGEDLLLGGDGADTLDGGNGKDVLNGGAGNDRLDGGNGVDTLVGGAGNDIISGGLGHDVFYFDRLSGDDVITDFDAKHEVLVFNPAMFAVANFRGVMDNAVQVGNDVVITYEGDDGLHTITLKNVKLSSFDEDSIAFG